MAQLDCCDADTDTQSVRVLRELPVHKGRPAQGRQRSRTSDGPKFDMREHLFKLCGVDLTCVDGIGVSTALVVISEIRTGRR